jgi:hypothetical protein
MLTGSIFGALSIVVKGHGLSPPQTISVLCPLEPCSGSVLEES